MKLIDFQPVHINNLNDDHISKLTKSLENSATNIHSSAIEMLAFVNQPNSFKMRRFNDSINKEFIKITAG